MSTSLIFAGLSWMFYRADLVKWARWLIKLQRALCDGDYTNGRWYHPSPHCNWQERNLRFQHQNPQCKFFCFFFFFKLTFVKIDC